MKGLLSCPVLTLVVLALVRGQEISYHPPRFARDYLISYNVSGMATAYPPYNVTSSDDYMYFGHSLFFPNTDTLIIGAQDKLLKLSTDLTVDQVLTWPTPVANFNECVIKINDKGRFGQEKYECGNHIRVYRKFPNVPAFSDAQDRMLVCGTYGLIPRCITVALDDITDNGTAVDVSGTGICSVHPEALTFGDFQGSNSRYFAMGFSDQRGKDFPAGMYELTYNTDTMSIGVGNLPEFGIPSENQWIASKVEIIDFRVQNYVESGDVYIIFLRENYQNIDSTTSTVQSRILRICKNDEGSKTMVGSPSIKYFTSFTKASVVCQHSVPDLPSSTGINEYDWPALRAIAYTKSKSRFYGFQAIWSHLIYGVFTGQINAANGTAICAYDTDPDPSPLPIDDYYTAYDIFRESTFTGESSKPEENKLFFNCSNEPRDDTLARQTLAVEDVSPYLDNKYPLLEVDGVVGTKLATDQACVRDQNNKNNCLVQDVLFMGTNNGRVMKIVISARYAVGSGVLISAEPQVHNDYDYAPVVAEEWTLDDSNEILALTVRGDYLYATTVSRVYKFPKQDCARYSSCKACIGSQDPYCYWNSDISACVTFNHSNADSVGNSALPTNYYQNITFGEDPICDGTPVCDLSCVSKNSGFDIIGADNCSYTSTISYTVSSACSGLNFLSMEGIMKADFTEIVSPEIRGYRLHTIDVTATSLTDAAQSTYSLQCISQPTAPLPVKDWEIVVIPVSPSQVDIMVSLEACSITDNPSNYNITIVSDSATGVHESFIYSNQSRISVTSLGDCSSFPYTVTVKNSRNSETYMSTKNAAVLPAVPGKPTEVTVSDESSRTAVISWINPSPAPCTITGHSIYLNDQQVYHCLPSDSSTFTFTGLFPYLDYSVRVHACTLAGEGESSDTKTFTTSCEPPSLVRGLFVANRTNDSLRFVWTAPLFSNGSDFSYTVETMCYDKIALTVQENTSSVFVTEYSLSSLSSQTLCCITVYQVATCMGTDLSGLPVQMCNATLAASPTCPTNLVVTATSYSSLLVQWDAPANAVLGLNYTIQVERTATIAMVTTVYSLDNTFAFVNGLEPNTNYTIYLSVENTGGSGSGSSPGSGAGGCVSNVGSTPVGIPPAPTNVNLATMDCTLVGSWSDPAKSSYGVVNYMAYARCNDIVVNSTIPSDAMSVNFNICDTSGALFLGGDLSWCTLQVQSCDGFSCGNLSELALTVVPTSVPDTPLCFITEELGSRVIISYTLSAPFALDDLFVKYSLLRTSDMSPVVDVTTVPFNGSNVLSFRDLFRNQEYRFSLQLCDGMVNCGGSCTLLFTPDSTTPIYPSNLRCSTTSTAVTVEWDSPPDENTDAIAFEVQLGGSGLRTEQNKKVMNAVSTTFTDLLPFTVYIVTARTVDITTNVSSPASPSIECPTSSDRPSRLQYLSSRVNMIDTTPAIVITWERPSTINGNFSNYTFVWGSETNGRSCQELYEVADLNMLVVMDYSLTSETEADSRATDIIAEAELVQLCGRVANSEFASEWLEDVTNVTQGALTNELGSTSSTTALIAVIVLAIISIIAALVIAIILAIAVYARRNHKLSPAESLDGMKENHHSHPTNIQRTPSTKPIIEHDQNSDTT